MHTLLRSRIGGPVPPGSYGTHELCFQICGISPSVFHSWRQVIRIGCVFHEKVAFLDCSCISDNNIRSSTTAFACALFRCRGYWRYQKDLLRLSRDVRDPPFTGASEPTVRAAISGMSGRCCPGAGSWRRRCWRKARSSSGAWSSPSLRKWLPAFGWSPSLESTVTSSVTPSTWAQNLPARWPHR